MLCSKKGLFVGRVGGELKHNDRRRRSLFFFTSLSVGDVTRIVRDSLTV